MKYKFKVLFATGFSSNSRIAIQLIKCLRNSYKVDVALIHVVPSFWKDWFASGVYKEEALQRLLSWQLELSEKEEPKKLHVDYGNPRDVILRIANTTKSNLIVLGGKEATSSGRYKTGTTIENVVRYTKKSVWICKNENISKILCGIDGSPSSVKVLQFVIDASLLHFALFLLYHTVILTLFVADCEMKLFRNNEN